MTCRCGWLLDEKRIARRTDARGRDSHGGRNLYESIDYCVGDPEIRSSRGFAQGTRCAQRSPAGRFSIVAAGRRAGEIAKELGISRKTVTTHFEHIKHKMGYANAEELKHGARELLGSGEVHARVPHNGEVAPSRVP
ncbi:MAG: hypothetical protein DME82_15035 [Verrucomicrobia bacterium]|nr:MAG: hypothetical protein DME82_15035 [Verrucomicrobiota bacterium]